MEGSTAAQSSSEHRSQRPTQTVVPYHFEDVDEQHLMDLIADMVDRLIAHNDQIPLHPDALTRFHSRSPPGISVLDYLARIVKYANVDRSCLLITLHYIDQICTRLPKFTITSLTVHRFVIASITVSSKALCDVFCTNAHYAKVGGIKTNELNLLEREFLTVIDYRLFCTRELLQSYYVNLVRTHSRGRYRLASEPPTPEPGPANPPLVHQPLGPLPDEAEDADSTAHACSGSGTLTEDEIIDDMSSDEDSADSEDAARQIAYKEFVANTPRTAAKRRAESVADESHPEIAKELRPRGRRRLDDERR